ncbi:MAG: tetratricopeptide repeat protein [Acidobacteriota bacterium]|nr:tetratricopeptide repeat protein [Acidobacteriota bacterium]
MLALTAFAQPRDIRFHKETGASDTGAQPPRPVAIPRSYALVIGISRYPNLPPKGQLQFPDRDAADIYLTLISPEGGQFPPENVHKLIGRDATLSNLRGELETWLPSVSGDNDRVLIYFAGHGFVSGGKAYLAPYDINPDDIPGTSYPMDRLGEVIGGKIKGKWKVLLADACHSGAILPASDPQKVNNALLTLNRSLFSFTASHDREQSFESPQWGGGHGAFSYYVVLGLQGEADESGDGVVTASELADYVRSNVSKDTGLRQNPTDQGSFDPAMVLAYNPSRVRAGNPPAPKDGVLVIETNMDGVEVFVDGNSKGIVPKGAPLRLGGISPGIHTVKGVRMGYEPDGPREENVYPGQETTVTIKLLIVHRRDKAALDLFERGFELYQKGGRSNYLAAAVQFDNALSADPRYSRAAMYLGSDYYALANLDKAALYFQRAIAIDPDYMEARARYGGMLLDKGDLDGAIRQLAAVSQHEPNNPLARYLLAQAFLRKGAVRESAREGREAVRLNPGNAEAHLWLADALRTAGSCADAESEYRSYLKFSDFDSKLAGQLNYYALGYLIGFGKKTRAAQHDIWRELRSQGYFGLCDCERMSKSFDGAIAFCQQALTYDAGDAFSHYDLALSYIGKYDSGSSLGLLAAARTHFDRVIEIIPGTDEADRARKYLSQIDAVLRGAGR